MSSAGSIIVEMNDEVFILMVRLEREKNRRERKEKRTSHFSISIPQKKNNKCRWKSLNDQFNEQFSFRFSKRKNLNKEKKNEEELFLRICARSIDAKKSPPDQIDYDRERNSINNFATMFDELFLLVLC